MRTWCTFLVTRFDSMWVPLGWGLFLGCMLLPFVVPSALAVLAVFALFALWWIVDLVDQQLPRSVVVTGVLMLAIGVLVPICYARVLPLAAWVIYWTRVRE